MTHNGYDNKSPKPQHPVIEMKKNYRGPNRKNQKTDEKGKLDCRVSRNDRVPSASLIYPIKNVRERLLLRILVATDEEIEKIKQRLEYKKTLIHPTDITTL